MLVYPNSTESFARREAGGKGLNLYLMSREGLPVPRWVVLGARWFDRFVDDAGLAAPIDEALAAFARGERTAAEVAAEVTGQIESAALPAEVEALVEQAFATVTAGTAPEQAQISVRSSAADEDSAAHSFAGQLSSFLYVQDAVEAARRVRSCWASGFSERGLAYRRENGLPLSGISVAVVLQEMIDPETSGVLFTCDPVTGDLATFLVSAVYGVGEGLVSGALAADTFWLAAASGTVGKQEIVAKTQAFRRREDGGCEARPVPTDRHLAPSLGPAALHELHALGRKLLEIYRRPQDVEWAIAGGRVHLLQTRPVTTAGESSTGYPNLWDNSNIVESYGGLTLPLSATFALKNYRSVYVQFCEILNVPREVVKDMDDYLRNMLGCINGRIYYNLYNWYKLVGVLPGFRQNRQFMETMMGVREGLAGEIEQRVRPHPSWDTLLGKFRRFKTGLAFLGYHFRIQGIVDRFLASFHEGYEHYRRLDFRRMASDEVFRTYLELDRAMISRWKAPIINDFLCMVHFGTLRKLTTKWLADLDENIQNDLLAGEGNLESAEPTKQLIRLAGRAAEVPALKALIASTPPEDLMEALQQSEFTDFRARIVDYIDRFGFRCMNEMKLEEIDLYSDPSYLFTCLKNYLRSGVTDLAAYERREKELRANAERQVLGHLSGPRRWIYLWSLKHARKAVRNRENTRFSRTRIYGVARSMFQAMGGDLCARGVLESPRDVFHLTLDEIYGIHQGTLPTYSLTDLVALRKRDYARFLEEEPKARFLTRGPVYWGNRFLAEPEAPDVEEGADHDLEGLPCCPGVVEGEVKVVTSARDDLDLDGEILVTPRTDPGWVPLYPSVSGLLVERGSLLSHSAIVAREMGLPAIVGIRGLCRTLRSGMRVRIDGKLGTIKILDPL